MDSGNWQARPSSLKAYPGKAMAVVTVVQFRSIDSVEEGKPKSLGEGESDVVFSSCKARLNSTIAPKSLDLLAKTSQTREGAHRPRRPAFCLDRAKTIWWSEYQRVPQETVPLDMEGMLRHERLQAPRHSRAPFKAFIYRGLRLSSWGPFYFRVRARQCTVFPKSS